MPAMSQTAAAGFLDPERYRSPAVERLEREHYATAFWHPVAALSQLPQGQVRAVELLGLPILLTRDDASPVRAFHNRCPHRAVAFRDPSQGSAACRRLICPYHGWTYDLAGRLLAAARQAEFPEPFDLEAWPLQPLGCQVRAGMIWVAIGDDPLPLEQQLDLVLEEAGPVLEQPRLLLALEELELACNWKIAHDNTLDDYHVAIAHPTTLHRVQGPVRHYRHRFGTWANVLATPSLNPSDRQGEAFLTFGLPPWCHLLLWPDGRLAWILFPPLGLTSCSMQVFLLGPAERLTEGAALMAGLRSFLAEDRALVESAQRGYTGGFRPGPPHRLEARILHQHEVYRRCIDPWLQERAQLCPPVPSSAAPESV